MEKVFALNKAFLENLRFKAVKAALLFTQHFSTVFRIFAKLKDFNSQIIRHKQLVEYFCIKVKKGMYYCA